MAKFAAANVTVLPDFLVVTAFLVILAFLVVLAFRSFWLSGRSDFSMVNALKNLFKKKKPDAQ